MSTATKSIALPKHLLPEESLELEFFEGIIERGLEKCIEVAEALRNIRDKKLYRARHETFEAYVEARWGMSVRNAYRMFNAGQILTNLREAAIGGKWPGFVLPANESQLRPLTGLTPDEQRAAWAEAVLTAPKSGLSGRHVASVVRRRKGVSPILGAASHNETGSSGRPECADREAALNTKERGAHPIPKRERRLLEATQRAIAGLQDLLSLAAGIGRFIGRWIFGCVFCDWRDAARFAASEL